MRALNRGYGLVCMGPTGLIKHHVSGQLLASLQEPIRIAQGNTIRVVVHARPVIATKVIDGQGTMEPIVDDVGVAMNPCDSKARRRIVKHIHMAWMTAVECRHCPERRTHKIAGCRRLGRNLDVMNGGKESIVRESQSRGVRHEMLTARRDLQFIGFHDRTGGRLQKSFPRHAWLYLTSMSYKKKDAYEASSFWFYSPA